MKKLLLHLMLLLLVIPAIAQNQVHISGTVTDTATGLPIPNHAVTISNDSMGGWIYYQTVYTNANGFYADTVPVALNSGGNLFVRTVDCQNYMFEQTVSYVPALLNFTINFAICNYNSPCQAAFTSWQQQPLIVQFFDASTGFCSSRSWDFGDGTISNEINPVHTYGAFGTYSVQLTVGVLGTPNYSSVIQQITVWDSTTSGCQAAFTMVPDSLNTPPFTYTFYNQSTGNNLSKWTWNFGDGTTQTIVFPQNPNYTTHTYAQPGTYQVCLSVQNNDSTCFDMTCQNLIVSTGFGCNAAFSFDFDSIGSPNTIRLWDLSTSGTGIKSWRWNFGDGTDTLIFYPNFQNISHTYAMPGWYNVCLTIVSGDSTCTDISCVLVGFNSNCVANFTHSIPTYAGTPVLFTDLSQGGGGAPIVAWNWNFGDGSTSNLQNPSHSYQVAGAYTVCLTIHGADSTCYDYFCQTIIIAGNQGCQANFSYSCSGPDFHTTHFSDLSTGNPVMWFWSFGDGTSSSEQNPIHTFANIGTYNVCLTITSNNCTSTFCQNVVIQDSTNFHQVYGQVFAGNFPVTTGLAMIFSLDTTNQFQPYVATSLLDSNGVYYFTMVPDGNYYILAVPFDSNGYLPTYYGNTINWELASLITLGTANNPYNINLVAADNMISGPGSTSGQINMGDVSNSMLDKINMILMNSQGKAIGFANVSTSGTFNFPSLAFGTYYLHPEMPGVTSDNIMITLSPAQPHADVIMTFNGKSILGIHDQESVVNSWVAFPNPVADHLTITIDLKQGISGQLVLNNITGKQVANQTVTLNSGENTIHLPTALLPEGLYTLRLYSKDGVILTTKLVKTR